MKRDLRIRKKKDFEATSKGGRFFATLFVLNYKKNELGYTRIGIIVSTKVSKRAVKRNLVRRRISESLRGLYGAIKPGYDIVVIASKKMVADEKPLPFRVIKQELERALKNTKLLQ